jgi:hypothetical protein
MTRAGLPDGFFSDQKSQFVYYMGILEDLGMEHFATYSGHLEYFTKIGYILWALVWYIFPSLWYIVPKNLATHAWSSK